MAAGRLPGLVQLTTGTPLEELDEEELELDELDELDELEELDEELEDELDEVLDELELDDEELLLEPPGPPVQPTKARTTVPLNTWVRRRLTAIILYLLSGGWSFIFLRSCAYYPVPDKSVLPSPIERPTQVLIRAWRSD